MAFLPLKAWNKKALEKESASEWVRADKNKQRKVKIHKKKLIWLPICRKYWQQLKKTCARCLVMPRP